MEKDREEDVHSTEPTWPLLAPCPKVWIADGAFSSWWMSTQARHTHCQWESWWSNMSSWDKSADHHMSSSPTPQSQTSRWPASHQLPKHFTIITHSPDDVYAVNFPKRQMIAVVTPPQCGGTSPVVVTWGQATKVQVGLTQRRKTPRQKGIKQGILNLSRMKFYIKKNQLLCVCGSYDNL